MLAIAIKTVIKCVDRTTIPLNYYLDFSNHSNDRNLYIIYIITYLSFFDLSDWRWLMTTLVENQILHHYLRWLSGFPPPPTTPSTEYDSSRSVRADGILMSPQGRACARLQSRKHCVDSLQSTQTESQPDPEFYSRISTGTQPSSLVFLGNQNKSDNIMSLLYATRHCLWVRGCWLLATVLILFCCFGWRTKVIKPYLRFWNHYFDLTSTFPSNMNQFSHNF